MTQQIRAIGAILLSVLIFVAGSGLFGMLTPVRADLEGFGDLAIGFIGSGYFAGFVAGCFIAPGMLARTGHIRTFAVAGGLAAATALLQSLFIDEAMWGLARVLFGFAAACVYTVTESWLNDRATNEWRGRILAAYLTVNFGGLVVGQWLYVSAKPTSFVLFNMAAIFFALCLVPVGLTRLPQPQPAPTPSLHPYRLFRIAPVGVAGCIAVGLANGAIWALAPVYARGHHLNNILLAAFMSAFTAAGAIAQVPVGRLSDRMDRRYVIAAMSFLAGCTGLALALFGNRDTVAAIVLFAVFGATSLPIYGLSVAHANDRIPREAFVEVSATLLLVNAAASVAGPALAALITSYTTTAALFFFAAGVHLAHVTFVLWRIRVMSAPIEVYHEPYAPVSHTATPVALELDPRGPDSDAGGAAPAA
jgi:MFS family permease